MTEIVLVRHGETFQNRHQVVQGQDPTYGRLTPEGMTQARALGQALAPEAFDTVYCSPLERAVLTLAGILEPRPGDRTLPLVFAPELKEINLSLYHGKTFEERNRDLGQLYRIQRPKGGENWEDVRQRAGEFVRNVIEPKAQEQGWNKVLVVAHGGVTRGILADFLGVSTEEAYDDGIEGPGLTQHNGCINRVWLNAQGQAERLLVNDTRHLQGTATHPGGIHGGYTYQREATSGTPQNPTPPDATPAQGSYLQAPGWVAQAAS